MTLTEVGHTAAPSSPTAELMGNQMYAKKVSLTAGHVLVGLEIYEHYDTPGDTHAWSAYLMSDNAGVPSKIIGFGSGKNIVATTSLGVDGSDRWMQIPMGALIDSTTDYWLMVRARNLGGTTGDVTIFYEGSGNDYRWTTSSTFASDYDYSGNSGGTNTGNDYLIRGVMLS